MDIDVLIDQYGFLVVLCGLGASIICGILKIPIAKYIRVQELGEKGTSDRIRNVCTAIVAVLSVITIAVYRCVSVMSAEPLLHPDLYVEILSSVAFAKVAYMLYEGVGPVSIKKAIHTLIEKIVSRKASSHEQDDDVTDLVSKVQSALTDIIHMPLTDTQKDTLEKTLRGEDDGGQASE